MSASPETLAAATAYARKRAAEAGIKPVRNPASLEAKGWRAWYATIFGQAFIDSLDSSETDDKHHSEAIEWHWNARQALLRGERPPNDFFAYFPIWSRGNMKTTVARRMAICDACLSTTAGVGGYALIVGGTRKKIARTASSLEILLTSPAIKEYYPKLARVRHTEQGASKGWRADFLNTEAGYVFDFAGLDQGMAGANEADVRPSFIMPDDIDTRHDSPVVAESNFLTFTTEVLPMRQADTLVFFAQNLISRFSVMYRIQTQQVRVLTNRKPTAPVPAVRNLVTETRTVGGIVKDVYVSGKPTWKGWTKQRIQDEIDSYGLPAFMRECQHDVEQSDEGLVLKNYNDAVHVISRSEFAAVYGTRELPQKWNKRVFNDWARTKTKFHANVLGVLTTASQNAPLPGSMFLFHPMSFPSGTAAEDVAARLLTAISPTVKTPEGIEFTWRQLITSTLQKVNLDHLISDFTKRIEAEREVLAGVIPKFVQPILRAQHFNDFRGSHEQSKTGALAVYKRVFGLPFKPVNPGGDGGVDTINLIMRVDYSQPHAFRPGVMGLTNFYVVADDDRSKSYKLKGQTVYLPAPYNQSLTPDDLHDADLFRYQASNCRFRDPVLTPAGEKDGDILKLNDDFINGLMMLFYDSVLGALPLTYGEQVEVATPEKYRYDALLEASPHNAGLTPEQELTFLLNKKFAEQKITPRVTQFNEYGDPIG